MKDAQNRPPVPNHVHGRVTDINVRLRNVRNILNQSLNRLRPDCEAEGDEGKAKEISHSVQSKLVDTSDLIHELEVIADDFENHIGIAEEDVPKSVGRAIG